jgi:heme/copper-type cytochrome/quinol oxidase subunit 2
MSLDAILFMFASWLCVIVLTVYCFVKLVKHRNHAAGDEE